MKVETLQSFVPRGLTLDLVRRRSLRRPVAALFADISGFTAFTERLAARGPEGVDTLTRTLNAWFGALIAEIERHGGEVVKFAGDGLLAVWGTPAAGGALRCLHAATSARRVLESRPSPPDLRLTVRMFVAAGDGFAARVGGANDRWEILVAGGVLDQVAAGLPAVPPGGLGISPEVRTLVAEVDAHAVSAHCLLVDELHPANLPPPAAPPPFPDDLEPLLRALVPRAAAAGIGDAGDVGWLSEIRTATVVFVGITGLDYAAPDAPARAQAAVVAVQEELYAHRGSLNKVLVDEKGTSVMAAFGLPPVAEDYEPSQAVRAGLGIVRRLETLGLGGRVGIGTGKVLCGVIGSPARREYTLIGRTVNLAARLMARAEGVETDAVTARACRGRVVFQPLPPAILRGFEQPVARQRALPRLPAEPARAVDHPLPLIGRERELAELVAAVDDLRERRLASLRIIEGPPGIGKSRLTMELVAVASRAGLETVVGWADASNRGTPYHLWRPVFRTLFGLDPAREVAERRAAVEARLVDLPGGLDRLPLLEPVLQLGLEDNEHTRPMVGAARADSTLDLLIRVLEAAVSRAPTLLLVEDVHWADAASWAVLVEAATRLPPLLLVVTTRPPATPPPEYRRLIENPRAARMTLEGLPAAAIDAVLAQTLGVREIPPDLADWFRERAEGSPFFAQELARAMREQGVLRVEDGTVAEAPARETLERLALPTTVEEVVTARIDRLTLPQQLVVKTAAVIGPVFPLDALTAAWPFPDQADRLPAHLEDLVELGLITEDAWGERPQYRFRHRIIVDTACRLMVEEQRARIHRALGAFYEAQAERTGVYDLPLLAWHWARTGDDDRARRWLEAAGEEALRRGAYREAADFHEDLLRRGTDEAPRRARWHLRAGQAHFALGALSASDAHLRACAAIAGFRPPERVGGWLIATLLALPRQIAHRLFGEPAPVRDPARRQLLHDAAQALQFIAYCYYFANNSVPLLAASVLSVNAAERAGQVRVARSYASLALGFGMSRLSGLARRYFDLARTSSATRGDLSGRAVALYAELVWVIGEGRWEDAGPLVEEGVALTTRLGDRQELEMFWTLDGNVAFYQGEYPRSRDRFDQLARSARERGNVQHQAWGLYQWGRAALAEGMVGPAVERLLAARELVDRQVDVPSRIICEGVLAAALLARGDHEGALDAATRAEAVILDNLPTVFSTVDGYAGATEALIAAWSRGDRRVPTSRVRRMLHRLFAHALAVPIAGPYWHRMRGQWALARGRRAAARRAWLAARRVAARYAMLGEVRRAERLLVEFELSAAPSDVPAPDHSPPER